MIVMLKKVLKLGFENCWNELDARPKTAGCIIAGFPKGRLMKIIAPALIL